LWAVDPDAAYWAGEGNAAEWTADYDPQFLVVWNVAGAEALYADGSRRTDKDGAVIGAKVAQLVQA
ncbi:MAG: hypothetical protein M3P18_12780, partial [Actinomycetota bacterium]|nr:hypothetical protein [Actinomycetota bacterium]